MGLVGIKLRKRLGFSWAYKVLYIHLGWSIEFRIYFKWHLWTRKYYFMDLKKANAGKGFLLKVYPFELLFSKTRDKYKTI